MSKLWAWVARLVIAACVLGLMASARNERQAYMIARAGIMRQAVEAPPTEPQMRQYVGR